MRFSTKIFITIVGVTMVGVLLVSVSTFEVARRLFEQEYTQLYQERLELVAQDFIHIEEETLKTSLNAAMFVRELESKTKFTPESLKSLAAQLSVDDISIIDDKGNFQTESGEHSDKNLFSLSQEYKTLFEGKKEFIHIPLVPDIKDPKVVAWFTLVPSKDKKHLIDIRNNFENFSKTLSQVTQDSSDIVQVKLTTPSGVVLGDVRNEEYVNDIESKLTFTIPATVKDCDECKVRGFTDGNGSYSYTFEAGLTNHTLKKSMAALKLRFFWITLSLTLLAVFISMWLTKVLLLKINKIKKTVDAVAASGDFSKRIEGINPDSEDELDLLSKHFNKMFDGLHEAQENLIEAKKSEARAAVAAQVAHDIRSPLTSMALALNQLQQIVPASGAEMFSLLSHAVSRVSGIVKRLSSSGNVESQAIVVETPKLTLIDKLFFDVAQEHALKMPKNQKLILHGYENCPEYWAVVQVTEMQTALSNILNNANEAVGDQGIIGLSERVEGKTLIVTIADNGKGIAPENLDKIFERGITLEKAGGSGLGLYQAKKAVEWSGGKITIESEVNVGTKIHLHIPLEKAPAFTTLEVLINKNQKLIVTDDDPMIVSQWMKKDPNAISFISFSQLENELPRLGDLTQYVFILDQYAGDGREGLTGTAFIEKYKISAYLSTSEYDDQIIQEKVKSLKAKLIPKPQLGKVNIKVSE